MVSLKKDLAIFKKFNFERQPVGVKYLYLKPVGIKKHRGKSAICETFVEAQKSDPFYCDKDSFSCAETIFFGGEHASVFKGGGLSFHGGYDLRAGIRFKNLHIPRMPKDIVNYVVYSPMDHLSFDPDVLLFTCSISQAEILLRASTFKSGKPWNSRISLYLQCAWLLVYPYLTGELNYTITGLSYGMKTRHVLPEGLALVAIPYDLLQVIIRNLNEMDWQLKGYTFDSREEYFKWFDSEFEKAKNQIRITLKLT